MKIPMFCRWQQFHYLSGVFLGFKKSPYKIQDRVRFGNGFSNHRSGSCRSNKDSAEVARFVNFCSGCCFSVLFGVYWGYEALAQVQNREEMVLLQEGF